jgi:hypothetical protein
VTTPDLGSSSDTCGEGHSRRLLRVQEQRRLVDRRDVLSRQLEMGDSSDCKRWKNCQKKTRSTAGVHFLQHKRLFKVVLNWDSRPKSSPHLHKHYEAEASGRLKQINQFAYASGFS